MSTYKRELCRRLPPLMTFVSLLSIRTLHDSVALPSKILFITELGIQEAKLYFGFWSCELREFRIQSSSAHRPSALLSQTSSQTQLRSLVLGTTFHWVWSNPVHTKGTMAPQMSLDNQLVNKNYLQSR